MPLKIVRNDIANMDVDAMVNTANPYVRIGAGVDSRIYKGAGNGLIEARREIGKLDYGQVAVTDAFNLHAKYVIHVATPYWRDDKDEFEKEQIMLLENCYERSLELAKSKKCETVAFPVLGAGSMGFPKALAFQTAVKIISDFVMKNDMTVYLVVLEKEMFTMAYRDFSDVESYIEENYVDEILEDEDIENIYGDKFKNFEKSTLLRESELPIIEKSMDMEISKCSRSLEQLMDQLDETFSESLMRLIDEKGKKASDIYRQANVDRKLFSKIKNNSQYQPKKNTVIAFAIALELNLDETKDLLKKAGYALSHSNKFDIIIEYFIERKEYDIFEINNVLFAFEQNLLGY